MDVSPAADPGSTTNPLPAPFDAARVTISVQPTPMVKANPDTFTTIVNTALKNQLAVGVLGNDFVVYPPTPDKHSWHHCRRGQQWHWDFAAELSVDCRCGNAAARGSGDAGAERDWSLRIRSEDGFSRHGYVHVSGQAGSDHGYCWRDAFQ